MTAIEPFCVGINIKKEESLILEADLFTRICEELKEYFRKQNAEYFKLMKFTLEMENAMLEENFLRFVINDILTTEAYSMDGIACYTNIPYDVIDEIVIGKNTNPSYYLVRKIIELHRSVRLDLYNWLLEKILKRS